MTEYGRQDQYGYAGGQPQSQSTPYGGAGPAQSGYGQQGYGQQGYGQPGHPAGQQPYPYMVAPEHPQGTTVLVLGIVSLIFSPVGFVAWYMGSKLQREIQETGAVYSNTGNITAGKIIGMITGILTIVSVALMIVYFVIFGVVLAGMLSSTG